ncbi:PrpF domain-containing protein [Actinoplanes missouriensis]|uniref:PrpF domain-containing protein n=1 Tax=Actinoplanes missouriensis TaxID=1866 RepID=UPI0033C07F3A
MGGGHSQASKVAVVSRSADPRADVDYLFLQVGNGISAEQTCGDILAGVGPFAVERGLVEDPGRVGRAGRAGGAGTVGRAAGSAGRAAARAGEVARVRVRMVNVGATATVHVPLEGGRPVCAGDIGIDGAPDSGARVLVEFHDLPAMLQESVPTSLPASLPTGRIVDDLGGVPATLIGNGVPIVVIAAKSVGVTGHESPVRLEYDERLRDRIRSLRLLAGELMGLGDVGEKAVPEVCLVAPPVDDGDLCIRMVLPGCGRSAAGTDSRTGARDRITVYRGLGMLAAAAIGAAAATPGSVAAEMVHRSSAALRLEHPSGRVDVMPAPLSGRPAIITTARLMLDGHAFPNPAGPTRAT